MEETILRVKNLTVIYHGGKEPAVHQVNFALKRGSSLGLIGESGSGKTSIGLAIMGLLTKTATIEGAVYYQGTELGSLSVKERSSFYWRKIAMVFQNSLETLNPVLTVGEQIEECLRRHTTLTRVESKEKVKELLIKVGFDPARGLCYPHQLSGGMRQRVLTAMALSCDPDVLIIDEPTTALDAGAKNEMIQLLAGLHRERKFALVVISHELPVIANLTSRIMVMYKGKIVEEGKTKDVLKAPQHTYTRGLINSSPALNPYRDLWGIPGAREEATTDGCNFFPRCSQRLESCKNIPPRLEDVFMERKVACYRGGIVTLLQGKGISKSYRFKGKTIMACVDCEIAIRAGEVVALIGESGSGKTTLAEIISGVLAPDAGEVFFEGERVSGHNASACKNGLQIVFQDPFSALNEHFTVEQAVREPLDILKLGTLVERKALVKQMLKELQLPGEDEDFLMRRCYTLSGGQRQRVALARSLVLEPQLLVADEISSMLDPSTQANMIRMLKGLQNTKGFAMLFITHDLMLARKIADTIYVMRQGRIIQQGPVSGAFSYLTVRDGSRDTLIEK